MTTPVQFFSDCIDRAFMMGSVTISEEDVGYLIEAMHALSWNDVDKTLPENWSTNAGRKVIPCLVVTAPPRSQPNRKPHVTVAQRQWNGGLCRWEWSRGLKVVKWKPLPEVD